MEELKELKKLINKARNIQIKKNEVMNNIFEILDDMEIDLDFETEAENADNLEQAIMCYIDFKEYNVNSIIKEIKKQIKDRS